MFFVSTRCWLCRRKYDYSCDNSCDDYDDHEDEDDDDENVENNQRECWYLKGFAGDFASLSKDVRDIGRATPGFVLARPTVFSDRLVIGADRTLFGNQGWKRFSSTLPEFCIQAYIPRISCTYIPICIHIHTYVHTYVHIYVRTYVHTYLCTYIPMYIHTYVHTYLCTYISM